MNGDDNSDFKNRLRLAIDELSKMFDRLSSSFDGIKLKVLALIGGEIAITPFVFSSFVIPTQTYGIVFFATGLLSIAVSFALLLYAIATSDWQIPLNLDDTKRLKSRHRTEEEFLMYLKEDYEEAIVYGLRTVKKKAKLFNIALILFSVGMIMLFVIKYTGGTK